MRNFFTRPRPKAGGYGLLLTPEAIVHLALAQGQYVDVKKGPDNTVILSAKLAKPEEPAQ